ncbi:hypothetical protein ACWENA_17650 [Streptomyces sp. NPDC004779]
MQHNLDLLAARSRLPECLVRRYHQKIPPIPIESAHQDNILERARAIEAPTRLKHLTGNRDRAQKPVTP